MMTFLNRAWGQIFVRARFWRLITESSAGIEESDSYEVAGDIS